MNKLYEYGLAAAEVGQTLIEPAGLSIPTAPSNTRSRLMSMGAFYAPTKNNPENAYFTYCAAIIDAILDLYMGASYYPYEQIKRQWETPGCGYIIKPFMDAVSRHGNASQYLIALSQLSASMDVPDNEDWKKQEDYIADWIKKFCNRQSDIKRDKANIQAGTSRYLTLALVFRSLADHLRLSFDDMNVYRGKAKDIMAQRKHSRRRDKLVRALKRTGFNLHYGDNIRQVAHIWVRVRVLHNSIAEFAAKESRTARDILKILQPFDRAAGYTRHPG
jgi:hypothetical protein